MTRRASRQQKRERDREEHQGPVLAALGAKGLVSVHIHVHEPAFMAATIIKKEKRNTILNDIEFFVWF